MSRLRNMNLRKPRLPSRDSRVRAKAFAALAIAPLALWAGALVQGCSSQPEPATPQRAGDAAVQSTAPEATAAPSFSISSLDTVEGASAKLDLAEKQLDLALQGKDERGAQLDTSSDKCSIVCRALASMRESAKHVCGLAADRCESANDRVKRAEERARGGCPVCATPS